MKTAAIAVNVRKCWAKNVHVHLINIFEEILVPDLADKDAALNLRQMAH
jgi:hypothetical protein